MECFREQVIWLLKGRDHCGEIYSGGGTQVFRSHKVRRCKRKKASSREGGVHRGAKKARRLGWTTARDVTGARWWDKLAFSCPECQLIRDAKAPGALKWPSVTAHGEIRIWKNPSQKPLHVTEAVLHSTSWDRGWNPKGLLESTQVTKQYSNHDSPFHCRDLFLLEGCASSRPELHYSESEWRGQGLSAMGIPHDPFPTGPPFPKLVNRKKNIKLQTKLLACLEYSHVSTSPADDIYICLTLDGW